MPRKPAQEMFETLKEMAEDLFGEDDANNEEKESYVTKHMQKLGYKMRVVFEDADEEPNNGSGNSFTGSIFGSERRQRRDIDSGRGGQRRSGTYGQ